MFLVEGNIGVGKSTFLKLLQKHAPDIAVILEPLDNWASQVQGQSLLENFYKEPQRWAYTLETLAMIARVKDHMFHQTQNNPFRVMERSVYSGHYCFAKNDHASGFFTTTEWEVYIKWADFLVHQSCKAPHGFIYLRAEPELCHERVHQRNRKGEESISLEYMQQIHYWHDKFLIEKDGLADHLKNVPVLVVDASHNIIDDEKRCASLICDVRNFMQQNV